MSLLSEVITAVTQKHGNPVYERELRGWSYIGLWRGLRRGCLPLMAVVILVPAFCCAATMALPALEDPDFQFVPLIFIAGIIGMIMGGEMILGLAGLFATALTATTISAEIETQTFSLLRMTTISPREIVLGKFGAAIRQLRPALLTVIGGRIVFPILLIIAIVIAAIGAAPPGTSGIPGSPLPNPVTPGVPAPFNFVQFVPIIGIVTSSIAALVATIIAVTMGLMWYLIQPLMTLMIFAAVGLLGSALSKTRTGGMFSAAGLRVAMWMGSYAVGSLTQAVIQLLIVPLVVLPRFTELLALIVASNPALAVLGTAVAGIVWLAISIGLQLGLTLILLRLTIRRTSNLPFNT